MNSYGNLLLVVSDRHILTESLKGQRHRLEPTAEYLHSRQDRTSNSRGGQAHAHAAVLSTLDGRASFCLHVSNVTPTAAWHYLL